MLVAALSIWSGFLFVVVVLQRRSIFELEEENMALRVAALRMRERGEARAVQPSKPWPRSDTLGGDRGSCSGGGGK